MLSRWRTRGVADRLLIAPQDLRTIDPTTAADIGAGYFAFGGRIVNAAGRSPFAADSGGNEGGTLEAPRGPVWRSGRGTARDIVQTDDSALASDNVLAGASGATSQAWLRQLAGFGWLRHLRAVDDPVLRGRGRELVDEFLQTGKPKAGPAWEAPVVARRLLSWLSQSPVILAGADHGFYGRFMRALDRHATELEGLLAGGLVGTDRLLAALALAEYGLCLEASPAQRRQSTDLLAAEIAAQLLPDGGHLSRNPQVLVDLLVDLLPLRQAYAARSLLPPPEVLNAIDRIIPMLRLLRHGDGTLALFNGMGRTAPELLATILAYDDGRGHPPATARQSGYQRLEAGGTVVIVDAGAPPPPAFSTRAHAGSLSFELSSGMRRLVINCGTSETARSGTQQAARATAAHSTLVIADTSSCRFAAPTGVQRYLDGAILAGPTLVEAERAMGEAGDILALSHDGYAGRFGLVHRRTLALAVDGARLDGCDSLVPATGKAMEKATEAVGYIMRFHLHPTVRARGEGASRRDGNRQGRDDRANDNVVRLDLPDGETWLFTADPAARVAVELSILFAAGGGPRPASQIVVGTDSGTVSEVRWSFERLGSAT